VSGVRRDTSRLLGWDGDGEVYVDGGREAGFQEPMEDHTRGESGLKQLEDRQEGRRRWFPGHALEWEFEGETGEGGTESPGRREERQDRERSCACVCMAW